MNRKGDIGDVFMYVALVFVIGISLLIVGKIALVMHGNLPAKFTSSPLGNTTLQKLPLMPGIFDVVMMIILVAVIIGLIVSVLMVDVHPLYFIAFIIGGFIILMITLVFSNVWGTMSNVDTFSNISTSMPKTNYIFSKLPLFSFIILMITGIILYSKMRYGGREI